MTVVDSPPGITSASTLASPASVFTAAAIAPEESSARRCSSTSPWRARTPTRGSANAQELLLIELTQIDAVHRLRTGELERRGDDGFGIFVMRGCRDDRTRVAQCDVRIDFRKTVIVVLRDTVFVDRRCFEDTASDEDAFGAELHHQRRIRGRRNAAGAKQHDGKLLLARDVLHEIQRRAEIACVGDEFFRRRDRERRDRIADRAHVADCLDDVARSRFALAANHRGTFGDAPQRLAEIARAADERHAEIVFGDVVLVVGGREHFGFVDVIDTERFEATRFGEMSDTRFCHHGNRDGVHDALHEREIAHARDAAGRTDVGRNAFEGHHGNGAGFLCDRRLFRRDDVHDHAALKHLREAALDRRRAGLRAVRPVGSVSAAHERLRLKSKR
jgi:hypothetical protein